MSTTTRNPAAAGSPEGGFWVRASDTTWVARLAAMLTDAIAEGRRSVVVHVDAEADLTSEGIEVLEQCADACASHDIEFFVVVCPTGPAYRTCRHAALFRHVLAMG